MTSPEKIMSRVVPLLQVADLSQSIMFYTQKLGFRLNFQDDGGFAILGCDDCEIFLAQKQNPVDLRNLTARKPGSGYAAYDLFILCKTGSIDDLYATFKAAGVPMPEQFAAGPINRDYGIRDFNIIDPDGYDIVFGACIK